MATGTTTVGFEEQLWQAADKLRSNMDAAEYKHVVLGLIFLKYVSDSGTDDPKKITSALLTKWAEKHISTVISVLDHLKDVTEDDGAIDEDLFLGTALALRLSETMRHELHQLFVYAKTEGIDMEKLLSDLEEEGKIPAGSKREGKEVLDVIRQRLI